MIGMQNHLAVRKQTLGFEPLEGRALMSVAGVKPVHQPIAAVLARLHEPKITDAAPGEAAFLNAIFGGAGHEFVALAQKEVRNLIGVIAGFESGAISQYSIPGLAIKSPPNLQSGYTGLPHDAFALQAAGALFLKSKKIELAAVVRGPFTTTPFATSIVFAINRGAGGRIGPAFANRPGITPDALVTVTVGPFGRNNSATITDLTTGSTVPISAPILVAGPTVRILLPTSSLPSEGLPIQKYKFAVWTEAEPNASIQDVGSFIPEDSIIPIGVETNVKATF
jgi:hypothetical protein